MFILNNDEYEKFINFHIQLQLKNVGNNKKGQ